MPIYKLDDFLNTENCNDNLKLFKVDENFSKKMTEIMSKSFVDSKDSDDFFKKFIENIDEKLEITSITELLYISNCLGRFTETILKLRPKIEETAENIASVVSKELNFYKKLIQSFEKPI